MGRDIGAVRLRGGLVVRVGLAGGGFGGAGFLPGGVPEFEQADDVDDEGSDHALLGFGSLRAHMRLGEGGAQGGLFGQGGWVRGHAWEYG